MATVATESERLVKVMAANVSKLLDKRKWTIVDLVRESGVPRSTIYAVLAGEREISLAGAVMIARALKVDVGKLLA